MEMKKYAGLLLCAAFVLSATAAFARPDDRGVRREDRRSFRVHNYIAQDCAVMFPKALHGNMDAFEDDMEYYIENSSFWERCVAPYLDRGQNAVISYKVFTAADMPNAREVAQAVKSAKEFTEELTDYIEDVQEYSGVYERPEMFTYLQVPSSVNINKQLLREVKKVNKRYKAKSDMPKIWVELDFSAADTRADIGAITVLGPGSKGIVRPEPRPARGVMPEDHLRPAHHKNAPDAAKPAPRAEREPAPKHASAPVPPAK